jgi:integrase
MPRARLTKSALDALPTPPSELVYWDETLPGFGVKVTPAGRKVFIVLYRTSGAGSRLRKYTIGPYGRVTLHVARNEAQRILAARIEGRDPATEKREARRRLVTDRVDDLVEVFIKQHASKRRSGAEIGRILKREIVSRWGSRAVHEIKRRDVIELVSEIVDRGAPVAANKTLKVAKTFFGWCVGKAILDRSPCEGVKPPTREVTRDRVLTDEELGRVIRAAQEIGRAYGGIVELLALTAQRREEVAQMTWDEVDPEKQVWIIPGTRTKNGKPHIVHLSHPAVRVIESQPRSGSYVLGGEKAFTGFSRAKEELDSHSQVFGWRLHDLRRTAVSGMARLGVAPHVADKILNHTAGTISGVAAVYQRHEFMAERKQALDAWAEHVGLVLTAATEATKHRRAAVS